ncbi:MAG TPA: hypothetical protein GXX39_10380 [Syntrophothermus lipocalidus]|uniref:Uncharacterized protein n=1 Tax=Syntrophothermus lipocalidus (strain DSM 12680 / TGB-C1) TaxID=643648 RepID=D7CP05_SYNLT|nr:hypothetical protein [Syntrophothermus lipocalidus]ADI02440.1 conserved hypothetical protein [Syntrophothermus lipocalidus DSM 12680]HHV77748.1 hypothetical protein [Syntrophothermus lipocalidus]
MERDIVLVFHNQGLRSYIEVDLCPQCPRLNDKGCCGYYSPVFYPTDLAYIILNRPGLVDHIFSLPHLTILDASVTVNSLVDDDGYRCQFHSRQTGCLLPMMLRESVCRHFVCPGIGWWEEESLSHWKLFFDQLAEYEIAVNNRISGELKRRGLTLRVPELRPTFYRELMPLFKKETEAKPGFFSLCPDREKVVLRRRLSFGKDWCL